VPPSSPKQEEATKLEEQPTKRFLKAGELVGIHTIAKVLHTRTIEDEDDFVFSGGGIFPQTDRPTTEQLDAEQRVRQTLFAQPQCSILDKFQGTSEGLLCTEQDTVCASFQDAFEPKKRNSYGSFEAMFQETLLEGDLESQFATLQNSVCPIVGGCEYNPTKF
jgi:hypothetical protein